MLVPVCVAFVPVVVPVPVLVAVDVCVLSVDDVEEVPSLLPMKLFNTPSMDGGHGQAVDSVTNANNVHTRLMNLNERIFATA